MAMNQRHICNSLVLGLPLLLAAGLSEAAVDDAALRRDFADPPLRWQSRPLWFWNGKLDAEKTKGMMAACKAAGYYGMGILPCHGMGVDFMSPEFLRQYKVAVDEAGKQDMKMCLYDEFWFPSGSAGGLLAQKHPEALGKRLDMLAADVVGPKEFTQAVPEGTLMGAVAMAAATHQRLDITASIKDGTLRWNVPAGEWKVMIFTCVRDGGDGLVDYLDPKAVDAFIKLTYQAYHDAMPDHFGMNLHMNRLTSYTVPALLLTSLATLRAAEVARTEANCVKEVSLVSARTYANPFTEVELDAVVTRPDGTQLRAPAFWAGGNDWRFRYASGQLGSHKWRTACSDAENSGLHGVTGTIEVVPYKGTNLLCQHGPVGIAKDGRHFAHADGTPFLWLGDTWWKNLCKRMTWEGFQELTADRKAKGFNVVQVVCGPYPDENFFAPSLENEGGQPYLAKDMSVINPKYFDYADRRFRHLVDAGIVPAIVGAWGRGDCNSMQAFGAVNLKRHWRYLIARYGACPVMWILAGEIADETKWGQGPWAEVAKYVREIDPYRRPLTCHTGQGRRGDEGDVCLIDYDMVGGNHDEREAVSDPTLSLITSACSKKPAMPVLCGETCYEGHMQQGFGDVQRRIFWRNMLSGAAGHTYGSAGVWHAGVEGDHGNWGAWDRQPYDWTTWKEGMKYPGSKQLGMGKELLEKYPWQKFVPHPEWAPGCFAAGIPGEVRFIYLPRRNIYNWDGPEVKDLEPDVDWHVFYFDPATGRRFDQGVMKATAKAGDKDAKPVRFKKNVPSPQDWVLVLERQQP
jgi:hypothetical protein